MEEKCKYKDFYGKCTRKRHAGYSEKKKLKCNFKTKECPWFEDNKIEFEKKE